jgi:hypothetical protein
VSALGMCLAWAAVSATPVFVPGTAFTLAWTHSVERVRWEEDYRVTHDAAGAPRLTLEEARVRGSAAGMEPPADAVLAGGWYRYRPRSPLPPVLRLTRSAHTADYELCTNTVPCLPMGHWLPSDGDITLLWPCTGPDPLSPPPAAGSSG